LRFADVGVELIRQEVFGDFKRDRLLITIRLTIQEPFGEDCVADKLKEDRVAFSGVVFENGLQTASFRGQPIGSCYTLLLLFCGFLQTISLYFSSTENDFSSWL